MKLFKKPNWLKPEINEPKYWLHLVIIAVVVLAILQYFLHGEMLTIKNVLISVPLILLGDMVAHSLLRLN
jgi:amino acid transporter